MNKYHSKPTIEYSTLVELLHCRTLHQPQQRAYTFLIDGEVEGPYLTYTELDCQARAIAALLQQYKARGERALLLYPPGLEFITAFCGCLYAGVIAIPAPPPDAARLKRTLPRLQAIAKDAQATLVLTTPRILNMMEDCRSQVTEFQTMNWLVTEQIPSALAKEWQPAISSDTLAYLQYTSGSTSTPKGVMVSHGNLMHHCAQLGQAWGYTSDSIAATWMPYFHDYGLIDGLIQPLYKGIPCFVMSPLTFIKHPIRWLQTISRYKVTHSQGPNFAYEHCVRRTTKQQCENLDLSSWHTASNGAEPIRKETLERFVTAFEPFGFSWRAFYPAYGLAEATLLVSTKRQQEMPVFCTVSATALKQNQIVESKVEHQQGVQTLVGCGHPIGDLRVVIAHPETLIECAHNQVGEIWVSDPSVAQGYWNRSEETAFTFHTYLANTGEGPFLRTGDLGFMKNGELFITGRLKDLIVIRGRNHYPQDIELTVEQSHPALKPSCGAAFSVDIAGEERLVVVQEVERHYPSGSQSPTEGNPPAGLSHRNLDIDQVIGTIRSEVASHHELEVYAVLLLRSGSILKTSSGKIQRQACRESFLDGSLDVVGSWTSNKPTEEDAAPDTSTERADDIINWLRTYANERINSRLIDERRCIPPYIVLDLGNRGLLGMQVPEEYGGIALKNRDAMRVVEQLAAIDLTLATFVCINNFLGIRPIERYATEAVRHELLPLLARGRELAAFALTEPGAGSNPRSISTTGVADGKFCWRLRGNKIWSGSASWSGVINVFVQLVDDDNNPLGITGFVVRQGTDGLRQGPESLTMGMRGVVQNAISLDNVPVGAVNLLGEPGSGMAVAQDAMLFTRLAIAAMCVGGMKRCTQLMLRYATGREIATGRLIDNPVTLARLSNLTAATTALSTLVARIAELLDNGTSVPSEAYLACKTSGPELLYQTADSLVQLLGGRGYIETNIAPQILRDARVFRIFEGPTETLNMYLGSRTIHESAELQQFLCNQLEAPSVWDSLKNAAGRINARWLQPVSFSDRPSALRYAHMLIGEVATYAILLAAVELALKRNPSSEVRRAVDWARFQFDVTLDRALSGAPLESVLLSADETTDLISSYAEAIGDLEQTLAGEDVTLDGLLHRNQAAANPNRIINLPEAALMSSKEPDSKTSKHTAESIETWLAKWVADELKIAVNSIDTRKSFVYYGLDSVTAIRLTGDLEVRLGRQLSPTLAWDYPAIKTLAQHLAANSDGMVPAIEVPPSGRGNEHQDSQTNALDKINQGNAEQRLAKLDHLSDEEVDLLLSHLLAAKGVN